MDWPGPIGSVTPRMLLKRLRNRHNEIREQLEHGCEELKEVSQLDNSIQFRLRYRYRIGIAFQLNSLMFTALSTQFQIGRVIEAFEIPNLELSGDNSAGQGQRFAASRRRQQVGGYALQIQVS